MFVLFSCSTDQDEQNTSIDKTVSVEKEKYIVDQLKNIEEVKNYKIPFDENESPVEMEFIFQLRPNKDESFYWIEVGYFESEDFQSCFNFYFYTADSTIKYYDKTNDRILSLEDWRNEKDKVSPFINKEESAFY